MEITQLKRSNYGLWDKLCRLGHFTKASTVGHVSCDRPRVCADHPRTLRLQGVAQSLRASLKILGEQKGRHDSSDQGEDRT